MFMLQEGRTCDWETFPGREELRIQLARCSESLKIEETIKKKETIRSKYDVPIPDHNTLWGPIFADMVSQYGSRGFDKTGMAFEEELISYWRKNRIKYPKPLTKQERQQERKKEEERRKQEAERLRSMEVRQPYQFDPTKVYRRGSWEEYFQLTEARERGIDLESARRMAKEAQMEAMKALVRDLPIDISDVVGAQGVLGHGKVNSEMCSDKTAREAQTEAKKALVHELPICKSKVDDKGKGVAIESSNDYDYDDDEWWAMNGAEVELIASQVEANKANPAYISINKDDADDDDWGDDELLIDHDSD